MRAVERCSRHERVIGRVSSAVVALGMLQSCLLPAIDESLGDTRRDASSPGRRATSVKLDASSLDAGKLDAGAGDAGEQTFPLRLVYSHRAGGASVDELRYLPFSPKRRGEPRALFTRPSISAIVGSQDGERVAFLASDSYTEGSPQVVWLIDGLDSGASPTTIASSNPALPRASLMADANLDYVLTCTGIEPCGKLELYRRREQTHTAIAENVWSAFVGYDNGLLVYMTSAQPLQIFWLDLTEVNPEPQLLATSDGERILWLGPANLAQTGRTLTFADAWAPPDENPANLEWTVWGARLGQTQATPLQSGVGLFASYTQRDGSSAVVVPTDIHGGYTKIVHHSTTKDGFDAAQELLNEDLEQEIGLGASRIDDIALAPAIDTYDTHLAYFGPPQTVINGKVFVTPHVLELDGSLPLALTDEPCQVYPSGHDMLSPRVAFNAESTAASLGWLRCNQYVGYVDLNAANSFTPVDSCPQCSPGKYFEPVGEGIVYAHVDANAALTPHYYVTSRTNPLLLIPGGTEIGKLHGLFEAHGERRLDEWRPVMHTKGAIELDLPRSWRKHSRQVEGQASIVAGETVHLGGDPLVDGGVILRATFEHEQTPTELLEASPERNACDEMAASDAGSLKLNGVSYQFYSELRTVCNTPGNRWLLALSAASHSVVVVFHDPSMTGEPAFERLWRGLRVDASRLNSTPVRRRGCGRST